MPISGVSTVSEEPSELSTVPEDIGEPMTQDEFADFFKNVLPQVLILNNGQQECDPDNAITVNGITYKKVADDKYNTVEKLKAEFTRYFTSEFIKFNFDFYFNHKMPYKEKDGYIYVNEKNAEATREIDKDIAFYRDSELNYDVIDIHTVQNGHDPFANYLLTLERIDGKWKVANIQCVISQANEDPAIWMD